jgi:hypothetical protein
MTGFSDNLDKISRYLKAIEHGSFAEVPDAMMEQCPTEPIPKCCGPANWPWHWVLYPQVRRCGSHSAMF